MRTFRIVLWTLVAVAAIGATVLFFTRPQVVNGLNPSENELFNCQIRSLFRQHPASPQRYSQTRNSDTNWSVLTGLAM